MSCRSRYQISIREAVDMVNIQISGNWRQLLHHPRNIPPRTQQNWEISGTLNFSKIYEKCIAEALVIDMAPTSDPSQYGNEKGISTQHYLIKMIDRNLTCLDSNDSKEIKAITFGLRNKSQNQKDKNWNEIYEILLVTNVFNIRIKLFSFKQIY